MILSDIDWCDTLAGHLALLPDPDSVSRYREDFDDGSLKAIGLFDKAGAHVASMLWRIDADLEFVIVAAAGRWPGGDITLAALPVIEHFAEAAGCRSVRLHTARPALVRRMRRFGYRSSEIVMRKGLGFGRTIQ